MIREDHWADALAIVLTIPLVIFLIGLVLYLVGAS